MRDIVLLGAIAALLAFAIKRPFIGMLVWAWFTLMTPHQLAYGVYGIPLNTLIAGVTIGAYFLSGEVKQFRADAISILIVLFAGWLTISQVFSLDQQNSALFYDRFIKTMLFALLCTQMVNTKLRIHAMIWMLVAGVGFFAAKGAVFTVITLGEHRVFGFPNTILEDNNHLGIAIATILPLTLYLWSQAKSKYLQYGLLLFFALAVVTILGTQSRGGFVSLVAFAGFYWFRSKGKVPIAFGMIALAIPAMAFMPPEWWERMSTITTATEDASFMGRIEAWQINWDLAVAHPVTGAGLRNSYLSEIAATVNPTLALEAKAAHSIYFEVLGSTGFIGLFIYLSLLASSFIAGLKTISHSKSAKTAPLWKPNLARALQVSLAVFCVGGASVSMEMWDGYLIVIALSSGLYATCMTSQKTKPTLLSANGPRRFIAKAPYRIQPR